ncbi:MAG: hypothetical protein KGJ93_02115 [Patescibacteria group bacterium]|nr:hypothetical protein [Patescibacteria group bacterium]
MVEFPKKYLQEYGDELNVDSKGNLDLSDPWGEGKEAAAGRGDKRLSMEVSPQALENPNYRQLLAKLTQWSEELLDDYQQRFWYELEQFSVDHPKSRLLSKEMQGFLRERAMDSAKVGIYDQSNGEKLLRSFGLQASVSPDKFIVVLRLPKPLDYFWTKNRDDLPVDSNRYGLTGQAIEWGALYRRLMPLIWDSVDQSYSEHGVWLERLNNFGEHSYNEYYYVWQAGDRPT